MLDRLFSSNEYVTLRFPKDEEILVHRQLVIKSRTLEILLNESHDNTIMIHKVAHETFDDVIRVMKQEDPIHTDSESVNNLIKALKYLDIQSSGKRMQKILRRIFKNPSSESELSDLI
ncbi:hypothetical protein PHSC3_000134 [Chlamydiales bacterium STE3]|nr:hypothetical protein PHSC3_000134 [Chlamydiales bacterium STE3]